MTPDVYKQQIVVVPRNAADNSPDLELQLSSSRLSSVLSSARGRGGATVTATDPGQGLNEWILFWISGHSLNFLGGFSG